MSSDNVEISIGGERHFNHKFLPLKERREMLYMREIYNFDGMVEHHNYNSNACPGEKG